MGWFWGESESKDDKKNQDPLRNLDPSLREFLAKESPVKYGTSDPATRQPAPQDPISSLKAQKAEPAKPKTGNDGMPEVPPQSQFPDGRYAHLWKTYVPQNQVEESMKSDAEKINDVLEGYKQRKAQIGRAAMENCVLEQEDVNACFESGGLAARMTMCRTENKKLDRCYTMQGKFLRALGYLSTYDRPPEVDEQIQMHADTLYHRMLDQEKEIEAAKAEGRPIPSFPPLLTAARRTLPAVAEPDKLPMKTQIQLKERLKGLSPEEKEIEEAAIRAEIESGVQVASGLGKIYKRQDEERQQRKEAGKETISDKFFSILRWY